MAHTFKSDAEYIATTHNIARFFTEHRQVALVLLLATFVWGWFGYHNMPKRKDPNIPVRVASAQCSWPGATTEQVEQLVTRPIEQTVALNSTLKPPSPSDFGIRSLSFPGLSVVYVQLNDNVKDKEKQFSDMNLKLNQLNLPKGAGPIQFNSNFGDTAALMLTVASPMVSPTEVALRAIAIRKAIERTRAELPRNAPQPRVSIIYAFPLSVASGPVRTDFEEHCSHREPAQNSHRPSLLRRTGLRWPRCQHCFDDATIRQRGEQLIQANLHRSEIHPDAWQPAIIRNPADTEARLAEVAGAKYSYRDLDDYTELIQRTLQGVPETSKVSRSGVLAEQIYLDYSQQRLAQYGYNPSKLKDVLGAQNITLPAGELEVGPKNLTINPSGLFPGPRHRRRHHRRFVLQQSGLLARPGRHLAGYQSPPTFLNYLNWRDAEGKWIRSRAVTLAVYMRDGQQIDLFGRHVSEKLESVKQYLPDDLIMVHTSDQPVQVKEQIDLFMDALYEAIGLVVIVSLIGFWEWRSALLMAISIPITLAMTLRLHLPARHRHPAGLGRLADHRARPAGRRPGRCRRLHQAHAGRRTAANRGALARPDQDRDRDPVRHHHQHRRLSALPAGHGQYRRVPLQPADRDDLRAGRLAAGVDDVHSAARLLPPASRQEARSSRSRCAAPRASPATMRGLPSSPSSIAGRSPSARWRSCCWVDFSSPS